MNNKLRITLKLVGGLVFLGIVLWLGGMFAKPGIAPGVASAAAGESAPAMTAQAQRVEHAVLYRAVGTLQSKARVQITARVSGQLLELRFDVGESVKAGEVLAMIDSRDSTARVAQARSALLAAEAGAVQAESAARRVRELLDSEASTPAQLEAAVAAETAATAGVAAARERLAEAEVALDHARITAPMDGIISARPVDTGDTAWPGAPLFTLLDPTSLRVEAWVREGALDHVEVGAQYRVEIPSRGLTLTAKVDEVVPSVDPRSRSFLVRASLPSSEGLHPGMFARLVLAVGQREVVEVERAAIRKIGQLDTTLVKEADGWVRRYVTLGSTLDGKVEVLTGLAGDETIGWGE